MRIIRKLFSFAIIFILTTAWIFSGWPPIWQNPSFPPTVPKAQAAAVNMYLFWDGGAAPAGWTVTTSYYGYYPRGEATTNFGVTGGSLTQTPTVSSVTASAPSTEFVSSGANADSAATHTHASLSVTVGPADNLPLSKGYQIIEYSGIPVSIPAGAIAIFDASAPTGWTQQTAYSGYMIQASSTVGTAMGSDTTSHSLTWSSLGAASGNSTGGTSSAGAATTHTHTAPAATNTASETTVPPYIQVVIAKANSNTASLPNGMIAMFDGDPGAAWTVESNSGGVFYQQFIRAAGSYNGTSTGSATHTYANATSGASGAASATAKGSTTSGTTIAGPTHTHTLTAAFNSVNILPLYFDVVYAKKNTNVAPNAPSQNSPAANATGVSVTPTFLMTATEPDPDNISYKVAIFSNSACTTFVQNDDQAASATGWTGTNATCVKSPTACYQSGTQGSYLTQSALTNSTQYWWEAAAKDPDGAGTFATSSCASFTTASALTFSVSTDNFSTLTPGNPVYATSTLNVNTSNASGWNVTLSGDNVTATAPTMNDGAGTPITDLTPQWSVPAAAATTTAGNAVAITNGQNVLAFRVMSASSTNSAAFLSTAWWGTSDAMFNSSQLWAGMASSTNVSRIGNAGTGSLSASNHLNTVQYYLNVPSTQKTGTYSGNLTYTATANP